MTHSKPNFIGIGGHKCASTWMAECLRDHPEIFMSNPKEIGFFSQESRRQPDWYFDHFKAAQNHKAVGEFTSYYLYDEEAPKKIRHLLGCVKCIVVVRDPISRALSQIKHGLRNQCIPHPSRDIIETKELKEMIETYPIIIDRSLYYKGIMRFSEEMGKDRVFIATQNDIDQQPCLLLENLYRFLGVDHDFTSQRSKSLISSGIVPKYQPLENLRKQLYLLFRNTPGVVPFIRKSGISNLYRKINEGNSLSLSNNSEDYLRAIFEEDWIKTRSLLTPLSAKKSTTTFS